MKRILPILVLSQALCTSLWFAGNAIAPELVRDHLLAPEFTALLISATQIGFIFGTFFLALLRVSDRFSPSAVFFISAVLGAAANLGLILPHPPASVLLLSRALTGICLAGIYPVGMKIAADYYTTGLGVALGFLVGALVLGTAFPHLLRSITDGLPVKYVVLGTSLPALIGGIAVLTFIPDGPHRQPGSRMKPGAAFSAFRNKPFRSAAAGYFGHMWELYAFWAAVPLILQHYVATHPGAGLNVPLLSFCIIAGGSVSCVISGALSQYYPAKRVAATALGISGLCCLVSPLFIGGSSSPLLISFLGVWSFAAIADSPLFSALVAKEVSGESRGTAITLVTCIGFAITIGSILLLALMSRVVNPTYLYTILAAGPVLGLSAMKGRSCV